MHFNYTEDNNNLIINGVTDFDIMQTMECGQCFHFQKIDDLEYGLVYKDNLLHIKQEGDKLILEDTSISDFEKIWKHYFDLDRDYKSIKEKLIEEDERLREVIDKNYGVRILNQDFTETLMSFIISQNKQIPHIKKIVQDLSRKYGNYLGAINGEEFYSFPDVGQLGNIQIEDYRKCKTGFRAPYLFDAAMWIGGKENIGMELSDLGYETAKEKLKEIKGVGDKVANCVLLFSLGYRNSFPVDVWIKRIMEEMYFGKTTDNNKIMEFAKEKFGELGGYAQQYLFFYARENLKK